jgi:hypothetical protein
MKRKLKVRSETIATLSGSALEAVVGGVVVGSMVSCLGGCNTLMICIDTHAATNCNCTGQTFQCPSVSCPPVPF